MKKLCQHPLFYLGLAIRFALIAGVTPFAISAWYQPFMDASTSVFTLDPWSEWTSQGGTMAAFPYGYAMWLFFLPMTLITKWFGLSLQYGIGATLLVADLGLLFVLHTLLPKRHRLIVVAYWLSPIVILASYGLGLNDLIPVLLLAMSVLFVRRVDFKLAGVFCAAAISAKLSMIVALPFFVIYLYNNRAMRQRLSQFLSGFIFCALLLGVPFLFSGSGIQMLAGNPEMKKVYSLAIGLGGGISVYLIPLIYLLILYLVWRVGRLNFDLFQATTGIAFLVIVLMTTASPGWFVWSMPFLIFYQAMSGRVAIALIGGFSCLYAVSTLLITPLILSNGREFNLTDVLYLSGQMGNHVASLLHTAMIAIGIVLIIRIWREAVNRNEFFRLSRKPFVIGIAGDSGAGKDTFVDSIAGLLGDHSVVRLSGDDYHLWDRQKPMWQVMTHLNPMANDLEGFCNDLVSLVDGKKIQCGHYDHQTGKMSRPFKVASNDFIIASGLHALYLPILRECFNLKIYLDIDEKLRRYFKLKRDVHQRGHTVARVLDSFNKREPDSDRFIRPQSAYADLLLSLHPIHPRMLEDLDATHPLRLKLVVTTRHGFNELSLNRVLIGVCGLHVDVVVSADGAEIQMIIEGETEAADVAMAAEMLCPRAMEFLDIVPKWQDGMIGLMQLVTLSHINQALTKRFI